MYTIDKLQFTVKENSSRKQSLPLHWRTTVGVPLKVTGCKTTHSPATHSERTKVYYGRPASRSSLRFNEAQALAWRLPVSSWSCNATRAASVVYNPERQPSPKALPTRSASGWLHVSRSRARRLLTRWGAPYPEVHPAPGMSPGAALESPNRCGRVPARTCAGC